MRAPLFAQCCSCGRHGFTPNPCTIADALISRGAAESILFVLHAMERCDRQGCRVGEKARSARRGQRYSSNVHHSSVRQKFLQIQDEVNLRLAFRGSPRRGGRSKTANRTTSRCDRPCMRPSPMLQKPNTARLFS